MKISDDIKYKIHFITDKQKNGEKLTLEEQEYLEKYSEFIHQAESFQIKRELEQYQLDYQSILNAIDKKEQEIRAIISKTRSKRKLLEFQKQLMKIKKLREEGVLDSFKFYIADTFPYDQTNINRYISDITYSDNYTKHGRMLGFGDNPKDSFIYENNYTGQVVIRNANILLAKEILAGNRRYYDILVEASKCPPGQEEKRQELLSSIPEELRTANPEDVGRIIYYGRGRIGTPKEEIFYGTSDVLDYLQMISEMQQRPVEQSHLEEINQYALDQIDAYIMGKIPEEKMSKYKTEHDIFAFVPEGFYYDKLHYMLAANNYDLTQVVKQLYIKGGKRTLVNTTDFDGIENGYVDEDGNLNLPNLTLACEIIDGNYKNYNLLREYNENGFSDEVLSQIPENLRDASPKHMSRLVYYGRGRIGNPQDHSFDKDFYDIKVLKILAEYQQALALSKTKTEEQEKKH